ncbi:MAG TPA: TIM44-like domain-containing protein [Gemmataceae bacterium]|jgi:predicted lipid-binding transport protein (Tim44 family)|nr:TIM44-like domain-containing protein [Gemmataceae bacterium]
MFLFAIVLAGLGPVLADQQVYYYGGPGCCCTFFIIWFFIWCIRKFAGEFERGQKRTLTDEEVLDDLPKKRQVMFKGEKVPEWKIAVRSRATKAICKFLSYTDNWFERKYLADAADEAFRLVKEAIEARSVQGIERRVTPDLLEELRNDIKKLKKNRERHVYGHVEVTDVNVLHVEAPTGKENHTFTALISSKSKDFFEDDETEEVLRSDKKTYAFQEFWSFRRSEKRWLVELIRPTSDADQVLESKNLMAAIDLEEFAKDADPEFLKEVVAR